MLVVRWRYLAWGRSCSKRTARLCQTDGKSLAAKVQPTNPQGLRTKNDFPRPWQVTFAWQVSGGTKTIWERE
jgi:hypothetical protein